MVALTVSGNRIVNTSTGAPVLLRGVNRSGFEYSTEPVQDAELETIVLGWGANVVRLPFNQEWALESEDYRTMLDSTVERLAALGAYSILDLQWLDARYARGVDENGRPNFVPALPNRGSIEVWKLLSNRYRGNPAVLYDIFNEPHDPLPGDDPALPRRVTAENWIAWARELAAAIRSENPGALIFVSGVNWAYDLSAYPVKDLEGVVYSTHVYSNKGSDWERAFGDLAAVAPVFAGEWGGTDDELEWGARLAAFFAVRNIGWTAWSWRDYPHLVRDGQPTPFGELVRGLLRAQQNP